MSTRVKICCIANLVEARLAIRHGADAIGLVSAMPSGPGVIDEAVISEIASAVEGEVETFLLTCQTDVDSIVTQVERCRTSTVQLVDELLAGANGSLRKALRQRIVQVVHVQGDDAVEAARAVSPNVDAILLDSGVPSLPLRQLGGTGRTHDWSVSRRIVDAVDVPVYLAGGLHSENVVEAIRQVRPYGVDLCSGLRTEDALDENKVRAFMGAVQGAPEEA